MALYRSSFTTMTQSLQTSLKRMQNAMLISDKMNYIKLSTYLRIQFVLAPPIWCYSREIRHQHPLNQDHHFYTILYFNWWVCISSPQIKDAINPLSCRIINRVCSLREYLQSQPNKQKKFLNLITRFVVRRGVKSDIRPLYSINKFVVTAIGQ